MTVIGRGYDGVWSVDVAVSNPVIAALRRGNLAVRVPTLVLVTAGYPRQARV